MLEDHDDTNDTPEVENGTAETTEPELTQEERNDAYGGSDVAKDGGGGAAVEPGGKAEAYAAETPPGPEDGITHIDTRNQDLAGLEHPETGVRYEHSTVELEDGRTYDVVAPKFESRYDVTLDKEEYQKSDYLQNKSCCEKLQQAVQEDPALAARFTPEQLEQIRNGDTPKGYTWHHDVQPGSMQLVDSRIHAETRHTGGRFLWGGGKENR